MSKTRTIGHVTLYEGTNGRWVSASIGRPDDFDRLLAREIDSAEYVRRLRQRTADEREADRLMSRGLMSSVLFTEHPDHKPKPR